MTIIDSVRELLLDKLIDMYAENTILTGIAFTENKIHAYIATDSEFRYKKIDEETVVHTINYAGNILRELLECYFPDHEVHIYGTYYCKLPDVKEYSELLKCTSKQYKYFSSKLDFLKRGQQEVLKYA